MSRAPGSGFPGFRAADRQAMPEQLRQRCRSYRYGRLACPDLIVRAQLALTDALQLHLVREVDRDGLRKTERLVEKVYKSDIANSASKLHKKPGLILFDSVGSGRLIPSRTTEPPMDWTHVQE